MTSLRGSRRVVGVSEVSIDPRIHLYAILPEGSSFVASMPGRTRLRDGTQYVIINTSDTHDVEVNDADSVLIGTITPLKAVRLSWRDLGPSSFAGIWTYTQLLDYTEGDSLTSRTVEYSVTVESNASDLVIRDLVDALGYDGESIADVSVLIPIDVDVFGSVPSIPALRVGTFPATSRVTIVNAGRISGAGGAGGDGAGGSLSIYNLVFANNGVAGGVALENDAPDTVAVYVDNGAGEILGGGGGGAGGGGGYETLGSAVITRVNGGGGGGGQGFAGSLGGGPLAPRPGYIAAGNGSLSSAGAGGTGGRVTAVPNQTPAGSVGGAGGGWGAAGNDGGDSALGVPLFNQGALGGAGGAAVVGNDNITWIATGTRTGAIT